MKGVLFALALGGCTDNSVVVSPVVDVPANDDASAFPLDVLSLSVAHQGSTVDLASASFTPGEAIELPGVPFGDDLVIHMTGDVGTSEVAYGRTCQLVVGSTPAPTPHLFFSRSVKFGDLTLALQPETRMDGIGIVDRDGAGLALGGLDPSGNAIPDVERFDPQTGELALLATVSPRIGAVAAMLGTGSDARIALIGGLDPATTVGATFIELIDADQPASRRIEQIDDATMDRVGLTATALTDGSVIVIGGFEPPSTNPPLPAVNEISLSSGSATIRTLRALLATPRGYLRATRLGGDEGAPVLVAGGLDATGQPIATAELFKPLSEDFSTAFAANVMATPRSRHQAVLMPDGSVLIIGGIDKNGVGVPTLELFTLDAGFVAVGDLPTNAGLVDFAATTLPDGRVLITGGTRDGKGPPLDTAFIAQLDPIDGSVDVVATDHMSVPRAGHQTSLLCDGTVLVTGGTVAPAVAERYNPPSLGRR